MNEFCRWEGQGAWGMGRQGSQDTLVINAVQREAGVRESGEAIPVEPGPQREVLWRRREERERKGKGKKCSHFHAPELLYLLFPPPGMPFLLTHIAPQESAPTSASFDSPRPSRVGV